MKPIQQQLHNQALILVGRIKRDDMAFIKHLQKLESEKVPRAFKFRSTYDYCFKLLKLSEDRACTYINVSRLCTKFPEVEDSLQAGRTDLSKVRRIAAVLTRENLDRWLKEAETLSSHDLGKKIVGENPSSRRDSLKPISEGYYALTIIIDEEMAEDFKRVQVLESNRTQKPAVLREAFRASNKEYLKRNDPLRKTPRKKSSVTKRTEKSESSVTERIKVSEPERVKKPEGGGIVTIERKPLPQSLKNEILRRDQGKCQFEMDSGEKCHSSYFIHLHHINPVAEGGENTLENLVVVCSSHHQYLHDFPALKYKESQRRFLAGQAQRRENRSQTSVNFKCRFFPPW